MGDGWGEKECRLGKKCQECLCCSAEARRAGSIGGLKRKEALLANASAALQNACGSEAACEFNLQLVLFQMPAQSM